jgi:hypothetical protein
MPSPIPYRPSPRRNTQEIVAVSIQARPSCAAKLERSMPLILAIAPVPVPRNAVAMLISRLIVASSLQRLALAYTHPATVALALAGIRQPPSGHFP